jgi:hypothetical protein
MRRTEGYENMTGSREDMRSGGLEVMRSERKKVLREYEVRNPEGEEDRK